MSNSAKFWIRTGFGLINGNEMRHFCCEQVTLFKFFGLHLDLDFTFANVFGLCSDFD